ncbi:MAG: TonB-dependent receptor [Deltaproteobacteria bacterium]|nr:TonB-dependent receptor [Candidatus Anaeroferrophillus wilburensis]MBN2887769.1 TonB-dependent receptor [Deltaproteobacteria bacterium]
MNRTWLLTASVLFLLCSTTPGTTRAADADQPRLLTMDTITVEEKIISPTKQEGDLLHTGSMVTTAGMELSGAAGLNSVFKALDLLPGINTELQDPFGIASKSVRIRGVQSLFAGMTVEGLPNYGIMPIGPRDDIYDMENMESIGLYKGSTPLNLGTGSGNRGGTIALTYRRPADEFQADLRQQFGSFDAHRTFFRLDSGILPTGTSLFGSYSYAEVNKWKGAGDLGPREHVNIGLSQELGSRVTMELFFNYNDVERHDFKPLTYGEADQIKDFYRSDYLENLTGYPAADVNYYDYHRGDYQNTEMQANLAFSLHPGHSLTCKPYYSSEEGFILDGKADKVRDLERYGITTEYLGQFGQFKLTAGYWYESHDLEKYVRANTITATDRIYSSWKYLGENHGNGEIHSPYLQVARRFGKLTCQAGLKYFSYTEPASTAYRGSAVGGTPSSYEQALNNNLGEDPELSLDEFTFEEWLPSFAIGCQLTPELEVYANYGRNYMRPYAYMPVITLYTYMEKDSTGAITVNNREKFRAAGLTLQDIFDDWKMETSDNIDVGLRYFSNSFEIHPALFFAKHHDLLTVAYDPLVGLNYHQNVGDVTTIGAEVELNLYPTDNLIVYINPSYTRMRFDDDLSQGGGILAIGGKQLPDTPELLFKTGLLYTYNNLEIAPTFKYVGRRYGDPQNEQPISPHGIVDLAISYTRKDVFSLREARASLAISNLFDEKYVGTITAWDDGSGTAYYAGAPFTAVFSLGGTF